jgi:TRAP transporter TAXI family solute receptor
MKKIISQLLILTFAMLLFSACSDNDGPVIRLGTGGASGAYNSYGLNIASVLSDGIPGLKVMTVSTSASKTNIEMVSDGRLQMAFAQNDIIHQAYSGQRLFSNKITGFSAIGTLYPEAIHIIASSRITQIEELRGKKIAVGLKGSPTEYSSLQVLDIYDIGPDDFTSFGMGFAEGAVALLAGEIDAIFCITGIPAKAVAELAETGEVNILEIDVEKIDALCAKYPYYTFHSIPLWSYSGCDEPIGTVAVRATLIVSNLLEDDLVYSITRTLFEQRDNIEFYKARYLSPEYAVVGVPIPFHPGAERYYREIGIFE